LQGQNFGPTHSQKAEESVNPIYYDKIIDDDEGKPELIVFKKCKRDILKKNLRIDLNSY
jgi:hypothetical protein